MAQRTILPPYVESAGYGKRFFAYLIDMVVIALGIVAFYFLISKNFILPAAGFNERTSEKDAFLTSSKLTGDQASSWGKLEYAAQEGQDLGYELYANRVWYYCTTYLANNPEMQMNPEGFTLSGGELFLEFLGNRHDAANVGKWTWANFFEPTTMYEPAKDDQGNADYTKMPVLKQWYKDNGDPAQMLKAFHNSYNSVGAYDDVYNHLFAQTLVSRYNSAIQQAQWISYIPAVVASPLIFNFIVPLFFPKGKTFGKLFLGTAVVGCDGFVAKKSKLAIRYGVVTACYLMLIINNYWIAIFGTQILMTLVFVTVALSGNMQGIHDVFADTIVIDEKKSKIFRTIEGRARYIENNPDSDVAEWCREKTSDEFMEQYGDRMEEDE